MPWLETSPVKQRIAFIEAWQSRRRPFVVELADQFGISEKTAHKWIARFRAGGLGALTDRSRRSLTSPNRTSDHVRALLIEARGEHPSWGPKKLVALLERRLPGVDLPSPSTAGGILAAEGLVKPRKRRRRGVGTRDQPFASVQAPNDLWCMDHKGEFTVERRMCYPLTLSDAFSRFVLACNACPSTAGIHVVPVLKRLFEEHGLPAACRSDNGPPFGGGIGGLSRVTVFLTHFNIRHEFITPGEPQENGVHERMHRTLKAEAVLPNGATASWSARQARFDEFIEEFNHERPHEALQMKTPAEVYTHSPRPYPGSVPPIEYPTTYAVRRVRPEGEIRWRGNLVYPSKTLERENIGIIESDQDGWWRIHFGPRGPRSDQRLWRNRGPAESSVDDRAFGLTHVPGLGAMPFG